MIKSTAFILVISLVLTACSSPAPAPANTPRPALVPATPVVVPTHTPETTHTPSPTRAASKGLGVSLEDVRALFEPLGYSFKRGTDRTVGQVRPGRTSIILFEPYSNLSKSHLLIPKSGSDDRDVAEATVFILLMTDGVTGDITWVFDALLAGKTPATKTQGGVHMRAEDTSSFIAITFTPR